MEAAVRFSSYGLDTDMWLPEYFVLPATGLQSQQKEFITATKDNSHQFNKLTIQL